MRKILGIIAVVLLVGVVVPAVAWGEETSPVVTETPSVTETAGATDTPAPAPGTDGQGYSVSVFGYVIVVVPPTEPGQSASVGVFVADGTGQPGQEVTSFTLGGVLGQSVSKLAQAVAPGPAHGKVVSTFVRTVNAERRATKRAEIQTRRTLRNGLRPGRPTQSVEPSGSEPRARGKSDGAKGRSKAAGGNGKGQGQSSAAKGQGRGNPSAGPNK